MYGDDFLKISKDLYESAKNEDYRELGCDTFEEYAMKHFGVEPRRARYAVAVRKKLLVFGISEEHLAGIGWEKATILVRLPQSECVPERLVVWIDRAKDVTSEQLEEEVRESMNSAMEGM